MIERAAVRKGGVAELPPPAGSIDSVTSSVFSRSPNLGIPTLVRIVDQTVLVADASKGPSLHLFNLQTGEWKGSVGQAGSGPGDFRGIWGVSTSADGASAFIYDFTLSRISEVRADSLGLGRLVVLRTIPLPARAASVQRLPGGNWFATNASDSALYQRVDDRSGAMANLPIRSFDIPAKDSQSLRTAYEGRACGTKRDQVAVAFRYTSQMTIVNVNSLQEVKGNMPVSVTPNFIEHFVVGRKRFMNGAAGVRSAYIDCTANSESIFALFGGRLNGKFDRSRVGFGQYVHEYDWTGRLLRVIRLDHDAVSLAVAGATLLTISMDSSSTPVIRKQPLGVRIVQPTFAR